MADVERFDSSDSSEEDVIAIALAVELIEKKKRKRRWWKRPYVGEREKHGAYQTLVKPSAKNDKQSFKNFTRLQPNNFNMLLEMVEPTLRRQNTRMRDSISSGERLAATLRFLATGDSYHSISYQYGIGRSTLSKIIPETCQAITEALRGNYLQVPNTESKWKEIASDFQKKCSYPNCLGAIDGKHIAIQAPPKSGSTYFNYKKFHSIVLLAVADAHNRFIWYDLGSNGRNNDAGIFNNSSLAKALNEKNLNIPSPEWLPNGIHKTPYVFIGDEVFPLKTYLMKPYPRRNLSDKEKVYNYRTSHARIKIENAFGILASRFRVLATKMLLAPEVAITVTEACIALYNFLRTERDLTYAQVPSSGEVEWGRSEERKTFFAGNNYTTAARDVRDHLCEYFFDRGQVHWQWDQLRKDTQGF